MLANQAIRFSCPQIFIFLMHLCSNANDTASRTSTSIARLLGLLVASPAEIISSGVDDNSTTDNALWTNQFDELVSDRALAIALAICLEVAQIAYMTGLIRWSTVCLAKRVEVGAGGCAPVCVVTELVDVHATLSIGVIASDVPCDGGGGSLGFLLEGNGAADLRVTSNGCNYNRKNKTLAWKDEEHRASVSKRSCQNSCL